MNEEPRLPIKTTVERLHQSYCSEMGYGLDEVPLTMGYHFAWQAFADKFTPDDLQALIRHIRKKGRMARSLQARHLITGVNSIEFAYEDLAEAKAMARVKMPSAGKRILAAVGLAEKEPDKLTTPASILCKTKTPEEMKAFFAKCKAEAGL